MRMRFSIFLFALLQSGVQLPIPTFSDRVNFRKYSESIDESVDNR